MSAADASLTHKLDALFLPHDRTDAPGLVVAVSQRGRLLYRRGVGMASLDQRTANTPATRMNLASTAKHMTAALTLLLAQEGRLEVDAPVRSYLPELPAQTPEPTLRQLMNHTSGYRCYLDLSFVGNGLSMKPKGYAFDMQKRQRDRNFAPGHKMLYCNGGYHLLSLITERVAQLPFRQLLRQRLFEPLGMHDTSAIESDFELHRGVATSHVPREGGGWRRGVFPSEEMRGDGAVISTVDDMLLWLRQLRQPDPLGIRDGWKTLTTTTRLASGSASEYGLGLVRNDYRGVEVVHHSGGSIGASCQMLTVPAHELDIIIFSNGAAVDPSALSLKIVDAVLQPHLAEPVQTRHAKASDVPQLLDQWYASPSGMLIGFGDADGLLGFSMLGNYKVPMTQRPDGHLLVSYGETGIGPFEVELPPQSPGSQPPEVLVVSECGERERFTRLPSAPDIDAAVEPLLGRYYSHDMNAVAELARAEGASALRMTLNDGYGTSVSDVTPLSDRVFLSRMRPPMLPVPGVLSVEAMRDGKVSAFRLNAARTRHLQFVRVEPA